MKDLVKRYEKMCRNGWGGTNHAKTYHKKVGCITVFSWAGIITGTVDVGFDIQYSGSVEVTYKVSSYTETVYENG